MVRLPSALLFCCTFNAVRSPMAAGLYHKLFPRYYANSAGVRAGWLDPFAVAAMTEVDVDISHCYPKSFEDLDDNSFDLVITLSPEAYQRAMAFTRHTACDVELWPTFDPASMEEGSREVRMDAYRQVRDDLVRRILKRFS